MNKTIKTLATLLACMTLVGTCLAAPRGGHGRAPAPRHHRAPAPRHHKAPPPPPRHHHGRHHADRHCGWVTLGAAAVGGLLGGILAR